MTFVRTKVTLEALAAGTILHVRLKGDEPLKNVPLSLQEIGQEILLHIHHHYDGTHSLFIRKT